ncbi:MAG TPA: DUF1345 domain-containing protein [Spongiibacteraceae bacterium]|jgi:uncharacterized membrane protein
MKNSKLPHRYLYRHVRARPRLFLSVFAGVVLASLLPPAATLQTVTRFIIGWNFGVVLYLLLSGCMMGSSPEHIRYRAQSQDEGKWLILILVIIAAVASMTAIVVELGLAKTLQNEHRYAHISLAAFTILSSWVFTHVMFALHYAHDYYLELNEHSNPGLQFPNDDAPDYGDFLYFAFVIGTSAQTADVNFVSKPMRRLGLLHCVLAFIFNTTVLALTINIAAGLF